MSRKISTTKHVGEVSSKYGYNPEKFDEDIQRHYEESERLYNEFKDWIREKKVDPRMFRVMFMRYYEEFIK